MKIIQSHSESSINSIESFSEGTYYIYTQKRLNFSGNDEDRLKLIPRSKNWDVNQFQKIPWIIMPFKRKFDDVYNTRQFTDKLIHNSMITFIKDWAPNFYILLIKFFYSIWIYRKI